MKIKELTHLQCIKTKLLSVIVWAFLIASNYGYPGLASVAIAFLWALVSMAVFGLLFTPIEKSTYAIIPRWSTRLGWIDRIALIAWLAMHNHVAISVALSVSTLLISLDQSNKKDLAEEQQKALATPAA